MLGIRTDSAVRDLGLPDPRPCLQILGGACRLRFLDPWAGHSSDRPRGPAALVQVGIAPSVGTSAEA